MPEDIRTITFYWKEDCPFCPSVEVSSRDWARANGFIWVKCKLESPDLEKMIPGVPALFTTIKEGEQNKPYLFVGADCLTSLQAKLAGE